MYIYNNIKIIFYIVFICVFIYIKILIIKMEGLK